MSFFSSPEPEEPMGTLEERESFITEIISYLSISTIGELIWLQRYLDRNFRNHKESEDLNINIIEQKKQEIDKLLSQNQSMISQIADIKNEKKAVEEHIAELEQNITNLASEKDELKQNITNLATEKDELKQNITNLATEKDELKQNLTNLSTEKDELKQNITNLASEKEEIKQERDYLAEELQRVANLYKEMTGRQANNEEIKEVLSIYITLMEDVFSGRVHFKVLSIIHGEKEYWTREELAKSTGVSEINLRSVLGDLVRANMIQYDEENATIRLLKRISSLD